MKVRENNRPERDSNSRPLTLYVGALPTELSGHASKSLLICSHRPSLNQFAQGSRRSSIAMCIGPAVERGLLSSAVLSQQQVQCTLRWSCDGSPVQIG